MTKSSQAFRTIREVADWLDVAAHVLRFWESKFPQIKPVKRAGGRRYYRPADMELVGGIKVLLHDRGLTIRGVQKMIREDGVAAIAALSPPVDFAEGDLIDAEAIHDWIDEAEGAEDAGAGEDTDVAPRNLVPFVVPAAKPVPEPAPAAPVPDPAPEPEPEKAHGAPPPEPAAAPERRPIVALVARAARGPALPPATLARLRPALAALRDRLRAPPSGPAA